MKKNDCSVQSQKKFYQNPILAGDFPDPSIVRDGRDYFMTNSAFHYKPGLLVLHSTDLINWTPLGNAVWEFGNIWAPEIVKHKDLFYIYYFDCGVSGNWVVTAKDPAGPWSDPVDTGLKNYIDPGHCVDQEGNRYLHVHGGHAVRLSPDGLSMVGELQKVYDGWAYPKEWRVEGFCLESPKITFRNGYYYLLVAQGGTAGPATSHMVVASRSRSPLGPWEHSPYNPIIHTNSREEKWWSKGHGTLVDTPSGDWWIFYHGYEKGYQTLGRQTLMEPIEWLKDGWFRVPKKIKTDWPIARPSGKPCRGKMDLSDAFTGASLSWQWRFCDDLDRNRYRLTGQCLALKGKGNHPRETSPLVCIPNHHAYEADLEVKFSQNAQGGLILYYNSNCYCGIGLTQNGVEAFKATHTMHTRPREADRMFLRIVNDHHDVSFFYSQNRKDWTKMEPTVETSGWHHNVFGGFVSLRLGLYATGEGEMEFRDFRYKGIE